MSETHQVPTPTPTSAQRAQAEAFRAVLHAVARKAQERQR